MDAAFPVLLFPGAATRLEAGLGLPVLVQGWDYPGSPSRLAAVQGPVQRFAPVGDGRELDPEAGSTTPGRELTPIMRCAVCDVPTDNRCPACKVTYYCGPKCQAAAWGRHKKNCKELADAGPSRVAALDYPALTAVGARLNVSPPRPASAPKIPGDWTVEKFNHFARAVKAILHAGAPRPVPAPNLGTLLQVRGLKPPKGWLETLLMEVEGIRFRDTTGRQNNEYFLETDVPDSEHISVPSMEATVGTDGAHTLHEPVVMVTVPARAAHVNPPASQAARILLVDLENQHGALTMIPRPDDYAVGFVSTGGLSAVRVEAARFRVIVQVAKGVPDACDLALIWHLAQLRFAEGLKHTTPVTIISADRLFHSFSSVVCHSVQVTTCAWTDFSRDEGPP